MCIIVFGKAVFTPLCILFMRELDKQGRIVIPKKLAGKIGEKIHPEAEKGWDKAGPHQGSKFDGLF